VSTQHPFHDVKTEPRQTVAAGNHNLFDSSVDRAVQKGEQPGSLPVDAAGNVFDDSASRSVGEHVRRLSFEVVSLLSGRDADVDDDPVAGKSLLFFRGNGALGDLKQSVPPWGSDAVDLSAVGPSTQCPARHSKVLLDRFEWDIHVRIRCF
jgi:hypothetical protein